MMGRAKIGRPHSLKPKTLPLLLLFFCSALASTFPDDASVLQEIAESISPPDWKGSDPCGQSSSTRWPGVNCDGDRVTGILLAKSSLIGSLPPDLNKLTKLTNLALQDNQLSGHLPSLSGLSSLEELYLDGNNFTSVPIDFFSGLKSLQIVYIDGNPFQPWFLNEDLSTATSLKNFSASSANLQGSIPGFFGSMPNLESLRLSYNNLTGPLPATFAGSGIKNLWLNNQQGPRLTGRIDVLATMSQLSEVWLHVNQYTGPIPDLANCTSLSDLQLRDNQFTGLIPTSLTSMPKLVTISLSNNKLQGPVPSFPSGITVDLGKQNSFCLPQPGPCNERVTTLLSIAEAVGYPLSFANSWEGNDPCSGWTYVTCDSKGPGITVLNFANLQLVGTISPAIADLTSLKRLVFSGNNLTGTIPGNLMTLPSLELVDVQNNNLTGKVPDFPPSVTLEITGNPFLETDTPTGGGSSGSVPGTSNATAPAGNSPDGANSTSSFPVGPVVGAVLGIVVFILIGSLICYRCYWKPRRKFGRIQSPTNQEAVKIGVGDLNGNGLVSTSEQASRASSGPLSEMQVVETGGSMVISIQVLRQVTDNFSEENVLGRGGFGVVYRGELHDGTKIAVKRMETTVMGNKGMSEFQAEIAVLTKVRHRHLVALLGYCIEGNERLLVYEYMPQGTLGQHLFEPEQNGYSVLTWKQRLIIALDVARGIEYLHSLAQQSFIHRDLKPSNILLGDDMRAKVSDFGLVKNAPDGKYSVETRLAGTFGYLAPEYAATGRVTTKVDVFAFGSVLMELITGRKALDESQPNERTHLVTWFRRVLINKDNIRKAIDPALHIADEDEENLHSICRVAELAGHCTAREPYQRPDMGHAVNVLAPLVEQWKPTSRDEDDGLGIDLNMSLPQVLMRWQANEGSTMSMSTSGFYSGSGLRSLDTQGSIPIKPAGFAESFNSTDCR